jgi:formylglycine-generating enzyme required for sulfatase activity
MAEQNLVPEGITYIGQDHSVLYVESFFIDVRPVTFAQYADFLKATGRAADEGAWQRTGLLRKNYQPRSGRWEAPVTHVTHEDALAYCAWAGKRLPTYMEWLRAALGKDERGWLGGPENAVELAWIDYLEGAANRNRRMERLIKDYVPQDGRPAMELTELGEWVSGSWHSAINELVRHLRVTWVRPYPELSQGNAVVVRGAGQAEIAETGARFADVTFRCATDSER